MRTYCNVSTSNPFEILSHHVSLDALDSKMMPKKKLRKADHLFKRHQNPLPSTDTRLSDKDREKLKILKSLPKYNSHCHLGGEVPLKLLLNHANPHQKKALIKAISETASGKDYESAFEIFPLIGQIINTCKKLEEATYQTCLQFKADNNQVVLMRTGLKQLKGKSCEDYLKAVLSGIRRATSENFKVFLLLSLKRASTLEMANLTVDLALKYRAEGIVGIDISDRSTVGDIRAISAPLLLAKENHLKIAVHMGESSDELDQETIFTGIKPDLIDHGVNLCKEAKDWVKEQNIPVTVCLTSSLATKMHKAEDPHPWPMEYDENGHPIDLGTDDSTVFGNISLSEELLKLCSYFELEKVIQIATESFERSKRFLSIAQLASSRTITKG